LDIAESQFLEWFSSDVSDDLGHSVTEWSQNDGATVKFVFTPLKKVPVSGSGSTYKFYSRMKFKERDGWYIEAHTNDV
tara:strand:- start:58 stop:291 length:234 start_codon:yes stop_codon:yes gene_type:complete